MKNIFCRTAHFINILYFVPQIVTKTLEYLKPPWKTNMRISAFWKNKKTHNRAQKLCYDPDILRFFFVTISSFLCNLKKIVEKTLMEKKKKWIRFHLSDVMSNRKPLKRFVLKKQKLWRLLIKFIVLQYYERWILGKIIPTF